MTAEWVEVRVRGTSDHTRDALVRALVQAGAAGVQELDGALLTHLRDTTDFVTLERLLAGASADASMTRTPAGQYDVTREWPTRVGVQRIGRIAVAPPWLEPNVADAELRIIIEPAMAFGTGEHETTRGVLQLMQLVVRRGDLVADLGAGSAVLAIAAARLGADRVAAIELDHDAIGNAEGNVARNGVGDRVHVIEGEAAMLLPLLAPVRVILANIISSVLLELAPVMRAALTRDGQAIWSGMLTAERDVMWQALERTGWAVGDEATEGDWWSCVISPR